MCPMFVFGSCSVRLVRYNVVPRIFRTLESPAGQPYAFISGSRTAPWKLVIYIHQNSCRFRDLSTFYTMRWVSDRLLQIGRTKRTRTETNKPSDVRFGSVRYGEPTLVLGEFFHLDV